MNEPAKDEAELVERMAMAMAIHFSMNRMPHMSGNPLNRLGVMERRRLDDATHAALAAIRAAGWVAVPVEPAPPYAVAVYEAVRALLRHNALARLEIGPGELEGDITVGLHAGWGDGEFVVMSRKGKCEWGLDTCDGSVARELAAALTAYADWCDEDAEAFLAGIEAHKQERARRRAEADAPEVKS